MPLVVPPAPAQSIEALRAALPPIIHRPATMKLAPQLAATLTTPAAVASLSPALSYRVFTLGLSDLAATPSNGLRAASLSAWRHTLTSNGEVVTADVSVDHAGANHTFASISANPTAPGVQAAIHSLSQDAED